MTHLETAPTNLFKRQLALVVAVFIGLAAGTPYLYGVYGPQLIKRCGLTTTDSATISLCTNIGAGFGGLPGGVIIDKFGPRTATIIGAFFITVGYYGVFQIYQDATKLLLLICVFMALMGFGSITSYFASLKTAQANFPKHKGSAGAIPVSCYGLSATLMSFIAATFFNGNSGDFIGFLSVFCGSITFVGSWFVKIYVEHDESAVPGHEEQLIENAGRPQSAKDRTTAATTPTTPSPLLDQDTEAVLLLSRQNSSSSLNTAVESASDAMAEPTPMTRSDSLRGSFSFWGVGTRTPRSSVSSISSSSIPLIQSFRELYLQQQSQPQASRAPISNRPSLSNLNAETTQVDPVLQHRKHRSPWQVVAKLLTNKIFLLHFTLVGVLSGIGQMYIYTVGFIVVAQYHRGGSNDENSHRILRRLVYVVRGGSSPGDGLTAALQALQVSIISISSFSGRLVAGLLSDYIYKKFHLQRLWIVLVTIVIFSVGQFSLLVIEDSHWLAVPSIINGASYGLIFGTYPSIIADHFGTRTFSTTWGLICCGPMIILFVLNKYFGMIYDANTDPATGLCYKGVDCYRGAFEFSLGLCILMFALTLYVLYIQRKR